eukprot:1167367-Amphidinium_carterae.1
MTAARSSKSADSYCARRSPDTTSKGRVQGSPRPTRRAQKLTSPIAHHNHSGMRQQWWFPHTTVR